MRALRLFCLTVRRCLLDGASFAARSCDDAAVTTPALRAVGSQVALELPWSGPEEVEQLALNFGGASGSDWQVLSLSLALSCSLAHAFQTVT